MNHNQPDSLLAPTVPFQSVFTSTTQDPSPPLPPALTEDVRDEPIHNSKGA